MLKLVSNFRSRKKIKGQKPNIMSVSKNKYLFLGYSAVLVPCCPGPSISRASVELEEVQRKADRMITHVEWLPYQNGEIIWTLNSGKQKDEQLMTEIMQSRVHENECGSVV